MTGNVFRMARGGKKPGAAKGKPAAKQFPSRAKVKYVQLPKEYWELLDSQTADGMKHEGRSVAYLAKIAVRKWLQAEGLVDEFGKPKVAKKPELPRAGCGRSMRPARVG